MSRAAFANKNRTADSKARVKAKPVSGGLRVGDPRDHFEQEADRVASTIVASEGGRREWSLSRIAATTPLQRKCECGGSEQCESCKEKDTLQRKATGPAVSTGVPPIARQALQSPGRPLDKDTRDFFQPRFGHDFGNVLIHTDSKAAESAASVHALAYTVGNDIVFARGQFQPGYPKGDRLLAHELAHTVQQERGPQMLQRKDGEEKNKPVTAEVNVRQWPAKLPRAKREGPKQQIKKVLHKLELENTSIGGQQLDAEQQAIVDKIKANREGAIVYPWLEETHEYKRNTGDKKGGFKYGGEGAKQFAAENPYKDPKRHQFWEAIHKELGGEGISISAVNTYDNAWVTLGRGLTGALLSRAMDDFLTKDEAARNMFLDLGAIFADGKLLVVNTDNGAIEADQLVGNRPQINARMLFAVNRALVSLYIHLAEREEHAKYLLPALQKQMASTAFAFTQHVADSWNDPMAVALAAHLVHWGGGVTWTELETCDDSPKKIVQTYARHRAEDAAHGNARVLGAKDTAILFKFAGGKAKQALDSPAAVDLGPSIAPDSQKGKLLLQEAEGGTRYFKVSL